MYLHRRLSDDKVFYVGKGKGYRATTKSGRNRWWKNTVAKHGFYHEIVFDNLSEEEAYELEISTILEMQYFYGDVNCNIAKGGGGFSGWKHSPSTISKLSDNETYTFVSKGGLSFKGTRREFKLTFGIDVTHLFSKTDVNSIHGWGVIKPNESFDCCLYRINRARADKRSDPVMYTFVNSITKLSMQMTRKEFADFIGVTTVRVGSLLAKKRPCHTVCSWGVCLGNETVDAAYDRMQKANESGVSDKSIYLFGNCSGDLFKGTRTELSKHFNVSMRQLTKLFTASPREFVQGWALLEEDYG